MNARIVRLPNVGPYQRYEVTLGDVTGEALALPELAQRSVDELSNALLGFVRVQ